MQIYSLLSEDISTHPARGCRTITSATNRNVVEIGGYTTLMDERDYFLAGMPE